MTQPAPPSELQYSTLILFAQRNGSQNISNIYSFFNVAASISTRSPTSRPTLPELLKFKTSSSSGSTLNIIQQIGSHYSTLGPLLLNDDVGAVTSAIASEHQQNAEAINQEILTRWLQGQGKQPVTWSTLIDVLKDVQLRLSELITESLNLSETSSVQSSGETVADGGRDCVVRIQHTFRAR